MSMEVSIDKRFGRFHLRVDFRSGGGVLGLLGPSGCGKSMILKCIAGVETPDSGRIVLNGRVLYDSTAGIDIRPQQRRVGYLFQSYALFPRMNVAENIAAGVRGTATDKAAAVEQWIRRLRLEGLQRNLPDQLSGGQQQRVALARMLAAEPEAVLLDEPFSALDAHLREHMQLLLLDTVKDCADVFMVSHSRDEIYKLCEQTYVLSDGKIAAGGGTRDLFRRPGRLEVARLLGCKNFSRAEILDDFTLRALDWDLVLKTAERIAPDVRHVAIRAHDFVPCAANPGQCDNLVALRVRERSEDPFEWNILFTNARAANENAAASLWWKFSKYANRDIPAFLRLPPEKLLLLTE